MKLYLLRHGVAVEPGTTAYSDDSKRPLTPEGKEKMHQNAKGMKALDLSFDLILSSPYLRAKETAQIVAQIFKIGNNKMAFTGNLIPPTPFEKLILEINTNFSGAENILLVGHEPHLSHFISFLLAGKSQLSITMKKGGLCQLSLQKLTGASCATLDWLLTPSQLRLIHSQ